MLRHRRLLIAAMVLAVALSRYTPVVLHAADGDLDPTFGDGGKVAISFIYDGEIETPDEAHAVAIQPDGRIVTAGSSPLNILIFLSVARTNPDGSPDLTFGGGGQVLRDFFRYQRATAVVVQPDGKILVGGFGLGWPDNFLLVRFDSDGSLDTSFGDNGTLLTGFGDDPDDIHAVRSEIAALALQSDGKIVAAGTAGGELALARYNPDGSLDPTFSDDGRVLTELGTGGAVLTDMALQADGHIVATGTWADDFLLVRYNTDGSLDTTFSDDAIVTTDLGGQEAARAVAIQADGKIVIAGETLSPLGGSDFALARYNADGTVDATFGVGGLLTTDFGGADDHARDVALQADGKIVAAGSSFLEGGPTGRDIALARYETDGTLDPTFGVAGLATTDIAGSSDDAGNAIAIQADGKIVVAGSTAGGEVGFGSQDFAIVRYENAPATHPLTFFLRGRNLPGTTGIHTMTLTPPAPQLLRSWLQRQTWFSAPILNGTFLTGSTFEVTLPCTRGISLPKTVRLASTDADGGGEQLLGEAAVAFAICRSRTIPVPVETPIELAGRRLKLTLISHARIGLPLWLGPQTFLRATTFAGAP